MALIALAFTGSGFIKGSTSAIFALVHQIVGLSLIILVILHTLTKRNKIKKLARDFWLILRGNQTLSTCPSEKFLITFDTTDLKLPTDKPLNDSQLIDLIQKSKIIDLDKKEDPKQAIDLNKPDLIQAYLVIYKNPN